MKNLQQSEIDILNNSEQFIGDFCADLFSISSGRGFKPLNFTGNKTNKTYMQNVYCTRRNLTELLSERTPFVTAIIA